MIVVGLLGAAVNVGSAWALAQAERRSLNVEGARAHVMTDLYASLGAALAGRSSSRRASARPTPSPRWSSRR